MKAFKYKTVLSLTAFAAVISAMPSVALAAADGGDEAKSDEIIVTAQRRDEKSVDVPITITSLSKDQLVTANVQELSSIVKLTPALRFDSQAQFIQPSIRGVGTGVTTSGGGANVGIYVDGFYSPNPLAADFDLLNVKSIQVLKGPQGTLFGRNTTGGAILLQSADPGSRTGGEIKATYGRFNEHRVQGYAGFGSDGGIGLDLEGQYRGGDGFQTDLTGNKKIGKHDSWSARAGVKVPLGSSGSLLLRYSHAHVNDPRSLLANINVDPVLGATAPVFLPTTAYTTDPDRFAGDVPNRMVSDSNAYQATLKVDLGFANLTSYTQYRTEDVDISEDLDHTAATVFQIGIPVKDKTFSEEVLLTSKPGGALQWTAGMFYFTNKDEWQTFIDNNAPTTGRVRLGGSGTTTRSFAAFLDATYQISDKFFITAGARYSHDQIDDAYYVVPFSGVRTLATPAQAAAVKKGTFTPRVVLRYKPSDQSSVYASYARGYKAGILDVGGSTGNPVQPEAIDAFEVGYKFDDRVLSIEASAFYYDYKNLQVSLFRAATAQIVNAASSKIYGLEGQMRYRLDDSFELNAGASWVHGRYKKFVDAPIYARCPIPAGCGQGTSYFVVTGTTLSDVTMQRTPSFTGNIGARYNTGLGGGKLALSGNLYYTSKFFFSPSGTQFPQDGYALLSLRAQWTDPSDHFTLAVFGDNVTSSRYRTQVQYNNFAIGSVWSAPAAWGVELGAKF